MKAFRNSYRLTFIFDSALNKQYPILRYIIGQLTAKPYIIILIPLLVILAPHKTSCQEYSISNIILDQENPAGLGLGVALNITFAYSKPDGDVVILARPYNNGNFVPNLNVDGSPTYTSNTGTGNAFLSSDFEVEIDQIRIFILRNGTSELLFEVFYNLHFSWLSCQENMMIQLNDTIQNMQTKLAYASECITFLPGLEVKSGGQLHADLIKCNN